MSDFNPCHPLHHEGTSRLGRLVQALNPEAFRLDERNTQDLIVEAHRFAQTLRFFDTTDTQPAGAYWETFWEVEILTYLAVVAATDTNEIRRQYQLLDEQFGKPKSSAPGSKKTPAISSTTYQPLLENLRQLALSLEEAYQKLVRIKHPLQTLLLHRIRRDNCCDQEELEGALVRLIGFHKGADAGLAREKYAGFFAPDKRWGMEDRVDYDAIAANPHFSQDDLRALFNTFFNTWLVLKSAAQAGFDTELARMELPEETEFRIVQPHVVLFLVFLRLFQHAQDSLNELGARHLDFYYEEVLGLHRRGEIADEVYLLFELAKGFDEHLLEKGTEFTAGKDKNGKPLLFETAEDWVLRPAQVADIKNTWIDLNCGGIHANPDVKKAYRDGAERPNENAANWRAMGDDRALPDGEIGFAIASPQLILREGKRFIDVTLNLENELATPLALKPDYFEVALSSTEDWITCAYNPDINPDFDPANSAPDAAQYLLDKGGFGMTFDKDRIFLRINLERDDLPVDHLGEELAAKAGFDTQWPILKVSIRPDLEKACPADQPCPDPKDPATQVPVKLTTADVYTLLRTLLIREIEVKVTVRGIRENLIIQTDQGVFNGTEKVYPFGPVPDIGHFFYIGSTEVFQKALTDLKVNIEWIGLPQTDFDTHYQHYLDDSLNPYSLNPKVQVDFIDKADATLSDQKEKVAFEHDAININAKSIDMQGTVADLAEPPTDNQLLVSVGSNTSKVNSSGGGKYSVSLTNVPFDANINLKESARDYTFQSGKTNLFKAFLLPANIIADIKRVYPIQTKIEIQVNHPSGTAFPKIKIIRNDGSEIEIDDNPDGKYFVDTVEFTNGGNLLINDPNATPAYAQVTLDHTDYLSTEFPKFTLLEINIYPTTVTAPSPSPGTSNVVSGIVKDRNNLPIKDAIVHLHVDNELKSYTTLADGVFTFSFNAAKSNCILQAFYNGARTSKVTGVATNNTYTLLISNEIRALNPFKGTLKGTIKSLEKDNFGDKLPVWGANVLIANTSKGESNSSGIFEVTNVDLTTAEFQVVHDGFLPIPNNKIAIFDNAEFEITLIPKPTYMVFEGKVVPFYDESTGLADVEVWTLGRTIKAKSNSQGVFSIAIPTDLSTGLTLTFSKNGFKPIDIPISSLQNPISKIKLTLPEANPVELLVFDPLEKRYIRNDFEVAINPLNIKRDPRTQFFSQYSPTLKRGFLRFKLVNNDFLHDKYPKVLVMQTLALSKQGPQITNPGIPNPPFTPATNFISLDYTSAQIITGNVHNPGDRIDQFYHLLPFNGHKQIPLDPVVVPPQPPVTQLIYPYMPDDTLPVLHGTQVQPYAPGNLFIGISDLQPGGTLSLLFQIEEGTEPNPEALRPAIHWSYLAANNTWLPFETGQILQDRTNGLSRTGMIQFAVPTTAVKENTLLDPAYFWLRAAAKQADIGKPDTYVQAMPSMTGIRAQVVLAKFKNADNELSHLATPLATGTISKLLESRTAVKKVEQPLESFGGQLPESMGLDFYYRVSERLRHKDRAVTGWDFEHLLLEHFPAAAAAKCIPHTRYKSPEKASQLAPGYATLAVIPDLKKRKGVPWPEPRFTQGDLDDMRAYLADKANLCVAFGEADEAHVQVVNPLYERVDLQVTVVFQPDVDEAFYKKQLQNALTHYISPWLADPSKPPVFGRILKKSAILQFIESQPYVDYIVMEPGKFRIRMHVTDQAGRPVAWHAQMPHPTDANAQVRVSTLKSREITEKICPGTARSILVAGIIVVNSTQDALPAALPDMPRGMQRICPDTSANANSPAPAPNLEDLKKAGATLIASAATADTVAKAPKNAPKTKAASKTRK